MQQSNPNKTAYTKEQQKFINQKHAQYQRLLQNAVSCTPKEREGVINLFFEQWLEVWEKVV